jgi:hypothetical protein
MNQTRDINLLLQKNGITNISLHEESYDPESQITKYTVTVTCTQNVFPYLKRIFSKFNPSHYDPIHQSITIHGVPEHNIYFMALVDNETTRIYDEYSALLGKKTRSKSRKSRKSKSKGKSRKGKSRKLIKGKSRKGKSRKGKSKGKSRK